MLQDALGQVQRGQGTAIFVSGEAGIGKTRLLSEAHRLAKQRGFVVLQGHCFERDISFPYAPLIDSLRSYFAHHPPQDLPPVSQVLYPELVKLLPELALAIPALQPSPALDAESEKRRLFEVASQFLTGRPAAWAAIDDPKSLEDRRGAAGAGLLILEDLHWADATSLEFLWFFSHRIDSFGLLLLASFRPEESGAQLKRLVAQTGRERLSKIVRLAALQKDQVAAMLGAIFELERPVGSDFLDQIFALSEGNPFFVEEILQSLISEGDIFPTSRGWERKPVVALRIPETVQAAIHRRVDPLGTQARALLNLAAVIGRRFDFRLLPQLTGSTEENLLESLKELIDARLIVEESAEKFAFRHELIRQTAYQALLVRERRAVHADIARALLSLPPEEQKTHVADLGYHCFEAGLWEPALAYSRLAGERAQKIYAPAAALEHFGRAAQAAAHLGSEPDHELLRALGQVHDTLGDAEAATAAHVQALAVGRQSGDLKAHWLSLLDLGYLWTGRDYRQAEGYLREAVVLARQAGDRGMLAQSLNRMGNWLLNMELPDEARQHHLQALHLFESLGDEAGMAATHDLLGLTTFFLGDVTAGSRHYKQAIQLFRKTGDLVGLAMALGPYSMTGASYFTDMASCPVIPLEVGLGHSQEALQIARQIGWRAGEVAANVFIALGLGPRGEFAGALPAAQQAVEIAIDIGHRNWQATARAALGALYLDMLALQPAIEQLESGLLLSRELGSGDFIQTNAALLASAQMLAGELESAEQTLQEAAEPEIPTKTQTQRQIWTARAELALARGRAEIALSMIERVIESAEQAGTQATPEADDTPPVIPRLWRVRALALAALGQGRQAADLLHKAERSTQRQGTATRRWRLLADLAALYFRQGDQTRGREAHQSALAVIEHLTEKISPGILRESFRRDAQAALPAPPGMTSRQAAKMQFGGLTAREREVARLVAQGLSNREISEALVISHRTVGAHVGNILNKLKFNSRAQIAAWAVERKL